MEYSVVIGKLASSPMKGMYGGADHTSSHVEHTG